MTNAEILAATDAPVVKATGDDMPIGVRAILIKFTTNQGRLLGNVRPLRYRRADVREPEPDDL